MEDARTDRTPASTADSVLTIMAVVLFIVVIALTVVIVLPFTKNEPAIGAIEFSLICLLVFVLLLRQGRLVKVKLGKEGIEATMAEAREATKEARETTREVKEFMKSTSIAVLGLVKGTGRTGVYGYDDKERIRRDILSRLAAIGTSPEEIEAVEKESRWHEYVALDYVCSILGGRYNVWGGDLEAFQEADRLRSRAGTLSRMPTPDELETFLKEYSVVTPEVAGLIEDYQYYLKQHEQRRPEVWAKRDHWYKYLMPKGGAGGRSPKERSDCGEAEGPF
jgi:hypothetical protein